MELEFSIESLLNKEKIESDRIEFKRDWNPNDIYRSICAFANDFDNIGGGYILIGVEERDGVAVRPVHGIRLDKIDAIQKEMVGFNHKIQPAYFAKIIPEEVDEKTILVLWVPTGVQRPYKTVEHVISKNDNNYKYMIRYGSSSVVANSEQERQLLEMSAYEPFDERGNENATIDDISPILLEAHLQQTGSKLAKQISKIGIKETLDQMGLIVGTPERYRIKNIALMMFCDHPDKFFPYMQVEIVRFPKGSIIDPKNFVEIPPIKGTVPQIIHRTMDKLQDMVISEFVQKLSDRMEANRFVSYPYEALEEAVVNAFYHRDYMCYEPVHIEIEPDCVRIISYPGIDRSIPIEVIEEGVRFKTRMYRNRRLGEFLKELDLTEGRCTGIPTIQEELEKNGSPRAFFETDEDRRAVCVTIPIQPEFYKGLDNQKMDIDAQNVNIGSQNVDIEDKNVDIEKLKEEYQNRLRDNGFNKTTIDNVAVLLDKVGVGVVFGRRDVINNTGVRETAASNLIKKMAESGVIVPVEGFGKSKYRFKS